jgi:hypothetical protein
LNKAPYSALREPTGTPNLFHSGSDFFLPPKVPNSSANEILCTTQFTGPQVPVTLVNSSGQTIQITNAQQGQDSVTAR